MLDEFTSFIVVNEDALNYNYVFQATLEVDLGHTNKDPTPACLSYRKLRTQYINLFDLFLIFLKINVDNLKGSIYYTISTIVSDVYVHITF